MWGGVGWNGMKRQSITKSIASVLISSTSKSHTIIGNNWDSNTSLHDSWAWALTASTPAFARLKYYEFSLALFQNFLKGWDPVLFILVLPTPRTTAWHFLGVLWN